MALGKKIRALREGRGWTLEQLSDASGVEVGTISALEVRDSQRTKFAGALAAALGVALDDLVSDGEVQVAAPAHPGRSGEAAWPFTASIADFEKLRPADRKALDKTLTAFISGALARYELEEMKRDRPAIHRNDLRPSSATMAALDQSIEAMKEVARGSNRNARPHAARKQGGGSR
ncbi:helix-turn-helix domain-containing protein [Bordetella bronchialis]|uniref:helix-turn-helix domain-containing protein n=1 Tax=Bordetella bronchialis TaxID=463025 RepID=UPI003D06F82B